MTKPEYKNEAPIVVTKETSYRDGVLKSCDIWIGRKMPIDGVNAYTQYIIVDHEEALELIKSLQEKIDKNLK